MIKFILKLVGLFGSILLYLGIILDICAIAYDHSINGFTSAVFIYITLVLPGFLIREKAYHFLKPKIEKNEENNEETKSLERILKTIENINGSKNSELEKYKDEMQKIKQKIEKNEEVKSLEMILKTVENINVSKNSELEKYKDEMQELKLKIENNEKARLAEHLEKIEKNKEKTTIKCPNCSALNTVIVGEICYCEFCGTPLKQNK